MYVDGDKLLPCFGFSAGFFSTARAIQGLLVLKPSRTAVQILHEGRLDASGGALDCHNFQWLLQPPEECDRPATTPWLQGPLPLRSAACLRSGTNKARVGAAQNLEPFGAMMENDGR